MAAPERFFVIMLNGSTPVERVAVQAALKKATGVVWHKFDEVWIVRGGAQARDWSDRLQPAVLKGAGSLLVLELPDQGMSRSWGFFGPSADEQTAWLHSQYTKDKG